MTAAAVDLLWREAADHHHAGRPALAVVLCDKILQGQPDHVPTLHLAAIIAFAANRTVDGTELLGRLFNLAPDHVPALVTLGDALMAKGERNDAAAMLQRAVALRPNDFGLQAKLSPVLLDLGRFADAASLCQSALARDPDHSELRFHLAIALAGAGHFAEAEDTYQTAARREPAYHDAWLALGDRLSGRRKFDAIIAPYRQALAADPANPRVHDEIGMTLHRAGQRDDAIFHFRKAVGFAPDDAAGLRKLAILLHEAGRLDEAAAIYHRFTERDPGDAEVYNNFSACLFELGRFAEAAKACDSALALKPGHARALINRGIIFERSGDTAAAIAMYRAGIAADPGNAEAHGNLALVLQHAGAIDEALTTSRQAVGLAPQNPRFRFNHSHLLLMCGDLQQGFADYRWRHRAFPGLQTFGGPEWQGEPFIGRTLLLFSEQGIGDALQFVRYLPMVKARGGTIVLQVQAALVPLLRTLPDVTVVPRGAPLPPFDLHLPLMDLPHVFGTTLDTVPASVPYLHANPVEIFAWRQALGDHAALKVGVVWAGGATHKADLHRSLAAAAVLPRLVMPGVQLYSLQKEPRPEDAPVLAALGRDVIDLASQLNNFADTAAAIAALDLIISVDTSVTHLAGAMGRPTWVLLPYAQDWRWLRDRDDSPWYPSLRLFRQQQPGAWDDVLARAANELRSHAEAH